jgi:hypothetical protein
MLTNRASILNQVAAGQLSAEEAARLIGQPPTLAPAADLQGRWLRLRITGLSTGAAKVAVTLPLTWVDLGLKLGAQRRPELTGIDWAEVVEQVRSGADGRLLEVENLEKDERIEIFVE